MVKSIPPFRRYYYVPATPRQRELEKQLSWWIPSLSRRGEFGLKVESVSEGAMDVKDGPVMCLMNKRVRGLRKKYNRILQIEESKAQGKLINKEQEDVLRSKPSVAALLDEYDKLRHPLCAALKEELAERHAGQSSSPPDETEKTKDVAVLSDEAIAELLKMLYFAHLFNVSSQKDFTSTMWTRLHERSSCLSYDYVTDDVTNPLVDGDLDALSQFGSLMLSRPPNATLSHKTALQGCVHHAKQWLLNSDRPIHPDLPLSYSDLRERLDRILSSEYFTMTPELQTVSQQTAAAAATAAGQYITRVLVHEASAEGLAFQTKGASTFYPPQDQNEPEHHFCQTEEHSSAPVDGHDQSDSIVEGNSSLSSIAENNGSFEILQSEVNQIPLNLGPTPAKHKSHPYPVQPSSQLPLQKQQQPLQEACPELDQELDEHQKQLEPELKEHRQPQQNGGTSRGYWGQKGICGVGSRGRGYTNGRGGRGGKGGGYSNGRGQYYDQGNYYPRNYHSRRARGGKGRGMLYDHHAVGTSQSSAIAGVTCQNPL